MITFDAGQTLVELDLDFLSIRLEEQGVRVTPGALAAAAPAAWDRYDVLVASGARHPWHALMTILLEGGGVADPAPLVEWLWQQQPHANLWRRPIRDMLALAADLAAAGALVGVLSNSEGRLAELFDAVGIAGPFTAIIDSGRVGIEKPDPRIFEHALEILGAPGAPAIHIGDSWAADIVGALRAAPSWRAIWFGRGVTPVADPRVAAARDAVEARAAVTRWLGDRLPAFGS